MAGIDPRGMYVGAAGALGWAGGRAADSGFGGEKAPDVDPVDPLMIVAEQRREAAVEARRLDVDLADPGDPLIVDVEDDCCRPRLFRRLLPAGLGDRKAGVAQIELSRCLAPARAKCRIDYVRRNRALQTVGREIEIELSQPLLIERQADPVHRARAALRAEEDVGVEF